jgi:hypothetical protein
MDVHLLYLKQRSLNIKCHVKHPPVKCQPAAKIMNGSDRHTHTHRIEKKWQVREIVLLDFDQGTIARE